MDVISRPLASLARRRIDVDYYDSYHDDLIVKIIKIYKIGFLEKAVDFEDITRLFYNICRFLNVCCVG